MASLVSILRPYPVGQLKPHYGKHPDDDACLPVDAAARERQGKHLVGLVTERPATATPMSAQAAANARRIKNMSCRPMTALLAAAHRLSALASRQHTTGRRVIEPAARLSPPPEQSR